MLDHTTDIAAARLCGPAPAGADDRFTLGTAACHVQAGPVDNVVEDLRETPRAL